jgi:predicted Zn-dependent protease
MKNLSLLILVVLFAVSCKKTVDTIAITKKQIAPPEVCVVQLDPNQTGAANLKKPTAPNPSRNTTPLPTSTPTETITPTTDTSYGVMLLDFDGQSISSSVWNNGQTFTCAPSGFDATQIASILSEVKADYARYRVIITTDEQLYFQAHATKRMRIVVTTTSAWYTGVGGVSYTGSLTWGDNTPCFAFVDRLNYNPHMVAEICSHELGHTAGLSHQSSYSATCGFIDTYNTGDGTNAPLMGNSLYATNGGSWWIGPTPNGCSAIQDDNKILTANLLLR